eukprot:CAMPEP_0170776414 /NCGR_PEP_ID=MMETSP0733-20121128/11160_1 /TAXON_ID=186038 /ORGANISM="Fragilariopsis kerguelensis, Strain L26-C5" /LENGTH=140 /DNA_ID=CAMNT_0011119399 /DNA_START=975 /DNA_END=1398 /DNA_ORIENTATION=+
MEYQKQRISPQDKKPLRRTQTRKKKEMIERIDLVEAKKKMMNASINEKKKKVMNQISTSMTRGSHLCKAKNLSPQDKKPLRRTQTRKILKIDCLYRSDESKKTKKKMIECVDLIMKAKKNKNKKMMERIDLMKVKKRMIE